MSVEIGGFEDVSEELQQNLELVDGERTVSFEELFTADFMQTYTEFDSIDAFLSESPWTVETESDFEQIPEQEFDEYVDEHTGFDAWEVMLSAAAREWLNRHL